MAGIDHTNRHDRHAVRQLAGMGRRHAPDPRDLAFPLRAITPAPTRTSMMWPLVTPVLDQDDTPMCVGYSWTQFLFSAPVTHKANSLGNPGVYAKQVYDLAQTLDEWPGTNYEGTSVRAGAKALQQLGRIREYRWAHTAAEARNFILTRGTLIIGINWYDDMFVPDASTGLLSVSGKSAGGHAILVDGYEAARDAFRLVNSWGAGWGQHGRAWLRSVDLDRLLSEDGECCSALEQQVVA
jgi:C1A family cysteine protease